MSKQYMTRKQNEELRSQRWLFLYDERLVSSVFPNVEKIEIDYEVEHISIFGNKKENNTCTYSPKSKANFIFECLNGECTSFYFNLKNVIYTMVRECEKFVEGSLNCEGSEAPDHIYQKCTGILTYKISLEYK